MLKELCDLVQRNAPYIAISIGYTKNTDWTIELDKRICIGQYERIFDEQHCDITYLAAKAYAFAADWLCETQKGY